MRGLAIDPDERSRLRKALLSEQQASVNRLEEFAGRKLIAKKGFAPKELLKLLYEDLKLPVQYNRLTKKVTANKEAIEKLAAKVDDDQRPIFADILTVRDNGVLLNTFIDAKLDPDGRWRWSSNLAGTTTGRISTSASPFWSGNNIQNIKETIRSMFVADPGYVFIYPDGEQAEFRAVAFLARDAAMIKVFESGLNVHCQMASMIFDLPLGEILGDLENFKHSEKYKISKTAVHGADYGVGVRKAALIMKKRESEARAILEKVHRLFPGIRGNFHRDIQEELRRTRTLVTPFGRRRMFFDRWGDELFRQAYAHLPQSTVGDWLNFGILRLDRYRHGSLQEEIYPHLAKFLSLPEVPGMGYPTSLRSVANQHDGHLAMCRIEHLRAALAYLRAAHTFEIPFAHGPLVIPLDFKIGFRWGAGMLKATEANIRVLEKEGGLMT